MGDDRENGPAAPGGRLVLVVGDPALALPAARKLIDEIIAPENQSTDLDVLSGGDSEAVDSLPARLVESCAQVGMFDPARCVWVRDLTARAAEALLEVLEQGLPAGASVVMTTSALDKRTRAYKRLVALAELIDVGVPTGREGRLEGGGLDRLIANRVKANGFPEPDRRTVTAVTARAGARVGELLTEVDRLCLLADAGTGLTVETVARFMRDQAGAWVFDLTDAISRRRLGKAEMMVEELLSDDQAAHRIVGVVSAQLGDLCTASAALDGLGRPRLEQSISRFSAGTYRRLPEALRARWPRPARAFHLMHGAARFSSDELAGLNRALLEVDLALKSSRQAPRHLFSRFLALACRPEARGRP